MVGICERGVGKIGRKANAAKEITGAGPALRIGGRDAPELTAFWVDTQELVRRALHGAKVDARRPPCLQPTIFIKLLGDDAAVRQRAILYIGNADAGIFVKSRLTLLGKGQRRSVG